MKSALIGLKREKKSSLGPIKKGGGQIKDYIEKSQIINFPLVNSLPNSFVIERHCTRYEPRLFWAKAFPVLSAFFMSSTGQGYQVPILTYLVSVSIHSTLIYAYMYIYQ